MVHAAEEEIQQTFSLLRSTATSTNSLAKALGQQFPFVTIPGFPQTATEILNHQTSVELVGLAPVVEENEMSAWSDYALANQGWIEDYREWQGSKFPPPDSISSTIIEGSTNPSGTPFSALPLWQMFPVTSETAGRVNTNLVTNTTEAVSQTLVEGVMQKVDVLTSIETSNILAGARCPRCSFLSSPIANVDDVEKAVGAIVWAWLSWDALFAGKLPDKTGRMVVEVENKCNGVELFYAVQGQASGFLGVGLQHDEQFDDLAVRLDPFGLDDSVESSELDCPFSVTAYPTTEFKNLYVTDAPWVYSVSVICVFFVAACVFSCYDHSIHRKQEKLLEAAQKTSAIVAEIFPKNVQQRIIEEKEQRSMHASRSNMNASRSGGLAPKSELKNLIGRDEKNNADTSYKGKPIADLFPEVTIMFADIVGFTAWSSTREPSQVFTLLEGLYAEFDRIAAKRRVFKVETIGDCYVAVVGLPDPRKDHAVVMSKFARDCLYKFKSKTREMEVELGPDTGEYIQQDVTFNASKYYSRLTH